MKQLLTTGKTQLADLSTYLIPLAGLKPPAIVAGIDKDIILSTYLIPLAGLKHEVKKITGEQLKLSTYLIPLAGLKQVSISR